MRTTANPTEHFSPRASHYAQGRPGYPKGLLEFCVEELGLQGSHVVADMGSGTGLLSEIFLRNGNKVLGVEPNGDMAREAERRLRNYPKFRSVHQRAEHTLLDEDSVDFISVGQAFHWFVPRLAREEFIRIQRPGTWTMVVWNERQSGETAFSQQYEDLLAPLAHYQQMKSSFAQRHIPLTEFFGSFGQAAFENHQDLGWEELRARVLSNAYSPQGEKGEQLVRSLRTIFERHEEGGKVRLRYKTLTYFGKLEA